MCWPPDSTLKSIEKKKHLFFFSCLRVFYFFTSFCTCFNLNHSHFIGISYLLRFNIVMTTLAQFRKLCCWQLIKTTNRRHIFLSLFRFFFFSVYSSLSHDCGWRILEFLCSWPIKWTQKEKENELKCVFEAKYKASSKQLFIQKLNKKNTMECYKVWFCKCFSVHIQK